MDIFSHPRLKYLLMLPVLIVAIDSVYISKSTKEIELAVLHEKHIELANGIDMVAAAISEDPAMPPHEYEAIMRGCAEYMDALDQVYAAVYKRTDDGLKLITKRIYSFSDESKPFEPPEYKEFKEMINTQESGSMELNYTPNEKIDRLMHIYYRWMPSYAAPEDRYLAVVGITEQGVQSKIALWVSQGHWIRMAGSLIINYWLIIMVIRLGHVYVQRKGNDKWRGENE